MFMKVSRCFRCSHHSFTDRYVVLRLLIELHHLKERLQDASNQLNQLQDIQGMFESLARLFKYY
jgi:hypothetical protein